MDFFDKLTKKASETYQVAIEKTSNISEELKLKSKASSLEDNNYQLFAEIGEKVYNELSAGKDVIKEEIMPKVETITQNKNELERIKAQIFEFRKMKKCINCGTELEKNAKFCSNCGAEQPTEEKVEVKPAPENVKETEAIEVNDVGDNKEE